MIAPDKNANSPEGAVTPPPPLRPLLCVGRRIPCPRCGGEGVVEKPFLHVCDRCLLKGSIIVMAKVLRRQS